MQLSISVSRELCALLDDSISAIGHQDWIGIGNLRFTSSSCVAARVERIHRTFVFRAYTSFAVRTCKPSRIGARLIMSRIRRRKSEKVFGAKTFLFISGQIVLFYIHCTECSIMPTGDISETVCLTNWGKILILKSATGKPVC